MPEERKVDILLVDDEPANLGALEAMLGDLQQNLVCVKSGKDALRYLLERDVAVILLDVKMPVMDGFETAALIRARERTRHVPIIFLTAFSGTENQVFTGYQLGAVDYMVKPIVPEVLRSKVSVFVELSRKSDEIRRQARLLREVEQKDHARRLEEAKRVWEASRLREAMERDRKVAEMLAQRAEDLARSVEERQRVEAALRASNERLRLLSETSNRLLLEEQPQAFLEDLYQRLASHLGLEVYLRYSIAEEDKTLRLDFHGGFPEGVLAPKETLSFGQGISGLVAQRKAPVIAENILESDDEHCALLRTLKVGAFAGYPLLAYGRLIGTVGFGTRRRARFHGDELGMMQAVSHQAAMAVERARLMAELQRRNDQLADAARRKDEFLAMLGHELRNPLAPIVTTVEILLRSPASPSVARAAERIRRQTRHMVRLVDDLLDVGRINSGKIEVRRQRVTVGNVIDQAVQTSRPLIDERQHQCVVSLPESPLTVIGDPTRLTQVVANLLNNAAKYTDPGGRIEVDARAEGSEVLIRVRDSGIGIRREMLSRIFELFVQADRPADRADAGLGIGLSLVRKLVEMQGGAVSASSDGPGRGSEFLVRFPLAKAAAPNERPAQVGPAGTGAAGPALEVLVVDDNHDIRATLRELLEMDGHHVHEADSGPHGVEAVLAFHPQVALIDVGLPGFDGYQVARKVRAQMSQPGNGKDPWRTRLIALTGYGQPEDRRRALEAGFDAHLVKPVDYQRLISLLEEPPPKANPASSDSNP